jgi:hypothetical protein
MSEARAVRDGDKGGEPVSDPFETMILDAVETTMRLTHRETHGGEGGFLLTAEGQIFAGVLVARTIDTLRTSLVAASARSARTGVAGGRLEHRGMRASVDELEEQAAVFEHAARVAEGKYLLLAARVRQHTMACEELFEKCELDGIMGTLAMHNETLAGWLEASELGGAEVPTSAVLTEQLEAELRAALDQGAGNGG